MRIKKHLLLFLCFAVYSQICEGGAEKFMNPITDVCWECVFPLTISGVNLTSGYTDQTTHNTATCVCAGVPPKIGVPIIFWEPSKLIDVTRHAYKMVGLGGITVGNETIKNRGSVGIVGDGPSQNSFYHVHWYSYPIFSLLELFTDFTCVEKGTLDVLYLSELDPCWNDDEYSLLFNAESALFANPMAQLACIADCAASSYKKPLDKLFWCAGCEGSLYPFTGTVAHHVGGIQASSLLLQRTIAKMHRMCLQKGYDEDEFCMAKTMPIIKKSLYKTQLVQPIPQTKGECHPLGKSDLLWGANKSYPIGGEDFVYLIWTKRQCCLDAVPLILKGGLP